MFIMGLPSHYYIQVAQVFSSIDPRKQFKGSANEHVQCMLTKKTLISKHSVSVCLTMNTASKPHSKILGTKQKGGVGWRLVHRNLMLRDLMQMQADHICAALGTLYTFNNGFNGHCGPSTQSSQGGQYDFLQLCKIKSPHKSACATDGV